MVYVVVLNSGDNLGHPTRPAKVHEVRPGALGKFLVEHQGSLTMILDPDVPVSHPYDHSFTFGKTLDKAIGLAKFGFKSLKQHVTAGNISNRETAVEVSRREYAERLKQTQELQELI